MSSLSLCLRVKIEHQFPAFQEHLSQILYRYIIIETTGVEHLLRNLNLYKATGPDNLRLLKETPIKWHHSWPLYFNLRSTKVNFQWTGKMPKLFQSIRKAADQMRTCCKTLEHIIYSFHISTNTIFYMTTNMAMASIRIVHVKHNSLLLLMIFKLSKCWRTN